MGLLALSLSCGGSGGGAVGASTATAPDQPVELALRTPDGVWIDVGDLRGSPVLLFLFATFDGVSQAALRPLARFARHHADVHVVGVAVQPDAAMLVDAWSHALSPPFVATYDPQSTIVEGTSDLGAFDSVPTYVMLGSDGHIVARHVGFASERKLERLLEAATRPRPTSPAP